MFVHNFVPEPVEIPGNIAQAPYARRLRFLKRTGALHFLSVGVVAALSRLPWGPPDLARTALFTLAVLALMEGVRVVGRNRRAEIPVTAALFAVLLPSLGKLAHEAALAGWPVWSVAVSLGAAQLYSLLCGRDFSFVGCGAAGVVGGSAAVAAIAWAGGESHPGRALALAIAAALYVVYDWASLLSRRREGEELGGVMDLYRDVLNFFGYTVRVARHWRRHRPFGDIARFDFGGSR